MNVCAEKRERSLICSNLERFRLMLSAVPFMWHGLKFQEVVVGRAGVWFSAGARGL